MVHPQHGVPLPLRRKHSTHRGKVVVASLRVDGTKAGLLPDHVKAPGKVGVLALSEIKDIGLQETKLAFRNTSSQFGRRRDGSGRKVHTHDLVTRLRKGSGIVPVPATHDQYPSRRQCVGFSF